MATYEGSVSFYDHISVEADDEEEAEENIRDAAERMARAGGLEVKEIVEITKIEDTE
jgi:hypothetical protein